MVSVWSVGGIHPTEGSLAYSACMCFRTREDAEQFRAACIAHVGNRWQWNEVIEHLVDVLPDLPDVDTFIARYWDPCNQASA